MERLNLILFQPFFLIDPSPIANEVFEDISDNSFNSLGKIEKSLSAINFLEVINV